MKFLNFTTGIGTIGGFLESFRLTVIKIHHLMLLIYLPCIKMVISDSNNTDFIRTLQDYP